MAQSNISIFSLNVRGLRSKYKRKSLFRYLKSYKYDIICLQETYITESVSEEWKKEWGGELVFSEQTAHSGGLIILKRKGLDGELKIEQLKPRTIVASLIINDTECILINAYAPNRVHDKLQFF